MIVIEHSDRSITATAKRPSKLTSRVIMIPAQIVRLSAYLTKRNQHFFFRLAVCLFVFLATLVGICRASPLRRVLSSAQNFYKPTGCTDGRFILLVDGTKTMLPSACLRPSHQFSMSQKSIVASHTKSTRTQRFQTTGRLTCFAVCN